MQPSRRAYQRQSLSIQECCTYEVWAIDEDPSRLRQNEFEAR